MDAHTKPVTVRGCTLMRTNDGIAVQHEDQIHTLNDTAGEIFELCNGHYTVDGIVQEMRDRYQDCEVGDVVRIFLEQLHAAGLISV